MNPAKFLLPILGLSAAMALAPNAQIPSQTQRSASKTVDPAAFGSRKDNVVVRPGVAEAYGKLPLSFEANHGQTDSSVRFLSRGRGYTLFLTRRGDAVLALHKNTPNGGTLRSAGLSSVTITPESEPLGPPAVVRINLVGGKTTPQVDGLDELPGRANYFIGNDTNKWRTNVPTYGKVRYRDVYPGVDLVYYGNHRKLEHDFIVQPGADPSSIVLNFVGVEKLLLDAQGRLVLRVKHGEVRFEKPRVYQDVRGVWRELSGSYVLEAAHRAAFAVGAYDASTPLVIDPVLVYSTYLGGSGDDFGQAIATDSAGSAYIVGFTSSTSFPTTLGGLRRAYGGGPYDAFVAKLNAAGSSLVYSTYVGGSSENIGYGIAVDSGGSAYVTGFTFSTDFPTTPGAFQTTLRGANNAFLVKLNAAGSSLLYSTYLGGSGSDFANAIAVDGSGNAYVTGQTSSTDFPSTSGAFQTTYGGGSFDTFVTKLNPSGSSLVYSTYLGGSNTDVGHSIAVDSVGFAYVAGYTISTDFPTTSGAFQTTFGGGNGDLFVTKLNAAGSSLVYSTYLWGSAEDGDSNDDIAVDPSGSAYVTGYTFSTNFPTTLGAFQTNLRGTSNSFVAKLNTAGSSLVYSTYLGGSGNDGGFGVAVDSAGSVYLTGQTSSTDFPTTAGAFQATYGGGISDAFVTKLNSTGSTLTYSTFLGGSDFDAGQGIATDTSGSAYVTGYTRSTNFPTTTGAFQPASGGPDDAFVSKIQIIQTTPLSMGPQAMEGNLQLSAGSTLQTGYDFTMPESHPTATVSFIGAKVTFAWTCASGPGSGDLVVPIADQSYTDTQGSSAWYPSGDQHSSLVYQGSIAVPDVCSGGLVDFRAGGTFSTGISSTDTKDKVNVRWHYSGSGSAGGWSGTQSVVP